MLDIFRSFEIAYHYQAFIFLWLPWYPTMSSPLYVLINNTIVFCSFTFLLTSKCLNYTRINFQAVSSSLVLSSPWLIPYSFMTLITMDVVRTSHLYWSWIYFPSSIRIHLTTYLIMATLPWIICGRYQFLVN